MSFGIKLIPVIEANEWRFTAMMSDYILYDFNRIETRILNDINNEKDALIYTFGYLFKYFDKPDKYHINLIETEDSKIVGFCIIEDCPLNAKNTLFANEIFTIEEIYIKPKYRMKGYGKEAVKTIFKMYKTKGSVYFHKNNYTLKEFWERTLAQYAVKIESRICGKYDEILKLSFFPRVQPCSC
jgi:predicted acetyltransferase